MEHQKERKLKVYSESRPLYVCKDGERRQYGTQQVSMIRLSGKWLENLGFGMNDEISVKMSEGQLVITKL